jgi:nucleoside-diphosphate-sugar epimerase
MRIFVTGGTGVLGRATVPLLAAEGHEVETPSRIELDLFDAEAVMRAVSGSDAVYHLATRLRRTGRAGDEAAWAENDRLRADASRLLVDAALAGGARCYVQPSVALFYPPGRADEETPLGEVPQHLRSALVAEAQALRFAAAGGRGAVLRLGLLYGPGTGDEEPDDRYGATLHIDDAATALVAALQAPGGIYNITDDDSRVANTRFKAATGWRPQH